MNEVTNMSTRWKTGRTWTVAALLMVAMVGTAQAQRHDRGGPGPGGQGHYYNSYNHNHYYTSRGYVVRDIPRGRTVVVDRYHNRYFYSGGVWYQPRGPRFVVVGPPIGAFVSVLPGFYSTVWVGGFPYYYANDTYYAWRPAQREYEVVDPPDDSAVSTSPPAGASSSGGGSDIFVYPKNGQNEEQTARDKYECHRWASSETGFDPTVSGGGVPTEQNASKRADYQRAMGACLEGRGYSVK
jgi:hypothetical protein